MKKNIYVKPTIKEIEIGNNCSLLAGSLGVSNGKADGTTPLSLDEEDSDGGGFGSKECW